MKDIGVKLHPLTKIKLFRVIQKEVFRQMKKKRIATERANEILLHLKKKLPKIKTPESAKTFYLQLSKKFVELETIKQKFETTEKEKIHQVLGFLVENILKRGDFDLASRVIAEVEAIEKKHGKSIEKLAKEFPQEFESAVQTVLKKSLA